VLFAVVTCSARTAGAQEQPARMAVKPAAAKQVRAANAVVPMPKGVRLSNICDPDTTEASSAGAVLTIACDPVASPQTAWLAAGMTKQVSDINCKYTENDQGGMDVKSCSCKADDDSNCTGFITWCAKQGGDVSGNNQSATCGG